MANYIYDMHAVAYIISAISAMLMWALLAQILYGPFNTGNRVLDGVSNVTLVGITCFAIPYLQVHLLAIACELLNGTIHIAWWWVIAYAADIATFLITRRLVVDPRPSYA